MDFDGATTSLVVSAIAVIAVLLVLTIIVVLTLSALKGRKGISKEYAEQIVMRRYVNGQVIGARFARGQGRWIWELDVLDGAAIHRVAVDARSGSIVSTTDSRFADTYPGRDTRMYGRQIG